MGGKAVPQGMGGDSFREVTANQHLAKRALDGTGGDGTTGDATGKQVRPPGMDTLAVRSEYPEQALAQHHVAVLRPFAVADVDEHPATVDVIDLQGASLRNAQSSTVGSHQNGTVLDRLHGSEKAFHLFTGQDIRQFM